MLLFCSLKCSLETCDNLNYLVLACFDISTKSLDFPEIYWVLIKKATRLSGLK